MNSKDSVDEAEEETEKEKINDGEKEISEEKGNEENEEEKVNSGEDESQPVKVNTNVKLTKTGSEDEEENMKQSEVADVSESKETDPNELDAIMDDDNASVTNSNPPHLSFTVAYSGPYAVNLSINVVEPIYVWCVARPATNSVPTLYDLLAASQHFFVSSSNMEIGGLNPHTRYKAYCYAESESGVSMKSSIEELAQSFTTDDGM